MSEPTRRRMGMQPAAIPDSSAMANLFDDHHRHCLCVTMFSSCSTERGTDLARREVGRR
jgi:hypothetical protein